MVQTPLTPTTLSLELLTELKLTVTDAQFEQLAASNRELRLERTSKGELMVNHPLAGRPENVILVLQLN